MLPRLLMLGIGLAAGYVLGTRDGRTRIDWMRARLSPVLDDPRVKRAAAGVERYARQQAPVIRERAEAAAKAAPGIVADAAQGAAGRVADVAKDVSGTVADTAKDVSGKVADAAKSTAGRVADTAKDTAGRVADTAKGVADRVTDTAKDVRERGESAVRRTLRTAGTARDDLLEDDEDDDAPRTS